MESSPFPRPASTKTKKRQFFLFDKFSSSIPFLFPCSPILTKASVAIVRHLLMGSSGYLTRFKRCQFGFRFLHVIAFYSVRLDFRQMRLLSIIESPTTRAAATPAEDQSTRYVDDYHRGASWLYAWNLDDVARCTPYSRGSRCRKAPCHPVFICLPAV